MIMGDALLIFYFSFVCCEINALYNESNIYISIHRCTYYVIVTKKMILSQASGAFFQLVILHHNPRNEHLES